MNTINYYVYWALFFCCSLIAAIYIGEFIETESKFMKVVTSFLVITNVIIAFRSLWLATGG